MLQDFMYGTEKMSIHVDFDRSIDTQKSSYTPTDHKNMTIINSELSSNTTVLAWRIMKYMCKVNIKDIPPVKISILLNILTLENMQKKENM